MKTTLILTAFLCCFLTSQAQFGPAQIISSEIVNAYRVFPIDIDGDGFIDVVAAKGEPYELVWFQNLDGLGNFGPEQLITDVQAIYLAIEFVDIDNDEDLDIIFLVNNPREIRWIENLDGEGNFGNENLVIAFDFITDIDMLDFDNDGDLDILAPTTDTFTGRFVWYENTDVEGNFGPEQLLLTNFADYFDPIPIDIDGDGDLDILTSLESYSPSKIVWYENDGNSNLVEHTIYEFNFFASDWTSILSMELVDYNNDGLEDIVINTQHDDVGQFNYVLANLNGKGNFDNPEFIFNLYSPYYFADLDDDGDKDHYYWYSTTNTIAWRENDGSGLFLFERIATTETDYPRDTKSADIDGDGLIDIIVPSLGNNTVAWYKNTGILDVSESKIISTQLYPNPTAGILYFKPAEIIETATVHDVLGNGLYHFQKPDFIDISTLPAGVYFIDIKTDSGISNMHKIIKK